MRYLITGHTGFKGSWLTFMLKNLGHEVHGLSLPPEKNSLYDLAGVEDLVSSQEFFDIRDYSKITEYYRKVKPEIIFHLAAQPLVRDSYNDPRYTVETNAVGTFNILEATRGIDSIKGAVIITTDKVYRNIEQLKGYKEEDPLGGHDAYSASKAMADIVAHSWSMSFAEFPVAIARAGNVVGGGDFSKDRLIPDIIRVLKHREKLKVRNPNSIRPWQHVLDCLNGYLALSENLEIVKNGDAWNFGPGNDSFKRVQDILDYAKNYYKEQFEWVLDTNENPYEAGLLTLDSTKAENTLNWRNSLDFEETLSWTFDWYNSFLKGKPPQELTLHQVEKFFRI